MIRIVESISKYNYGDDRRYLELAGLSTDPKPVDRLVTGSLFLEVDTGSVYAFDEISETWNQIGG